MSSYISFSISTTLDQTIVNFDTDSVVLGQLLALLQCSQSSQSSKVELLHPDADFKTPLSTKGIRFGQGKQGEPETFVLKIKEVFKYWRGLVWRQMSQPERALTDQTWDNLSFKMNNSPNYKPLIETESMSSCWE